MAALLLAAEEEARRRGDRHLGAEHLALALARPQGPASALLAELGVDPLDWRDQITTVLAWSEGARAERESRPAGSMAGSLAELRFSGGLAMERAVPHIVELAQHEATANDSDVGPAHLLVGVLVEAESVGAATGQWLGLSPGRVRAAAGLRNHRRAVAGGAEPGRRSRGSSTGPLVLCGGGTDADLLAEVVALAAGRAGSDGPRAVLVDLAWHTLPPTAEQRRSNLDRLAAAGAALAVDSGLTVRDDAASAEVCRRLGAADLVWLTGGDAAALYDRLWATPALDAIREAHANGAVVGGVSAGAIVWGAGTLSDFASLGEAEPFPLFGWLGDLVVVAHYASGRERALRNRLAAFPGCRGLAVAHGGAVVVAPGDDGLRVLRPGMGGIDSVVLDGPDQPLSPVQRPGVEGGAVWSASG